MDREILLNEHIVKITHFHKVLFPESNITKDQLVNYYLNISETILSYLQNRALTLQRFPEGISEPGFFHKNASDFFPDWIQRVELPKQNGMVNYVVVKSVADILYLVNLNTIVFHISLSKIQNIQFPDMLVLDLDPDGADFSTIKWAAQKIKEITDSLELPLFVKTTGSRGLHLHIPLDNSSNFEETHGFAKRLANYAAACYPEVLTIQPQKRKRSGRVFVDYIRNSYGQTVVAPYSVRAKEGAPVATPIEWDELNRDITGANFFNIFTIFDRLNHKGDIWKNLNKYACSFKKANEILKRKHQN